ncbi:hypothetical protein GQ457_05G031260 [Hibiscus cannabinus]
MALRWVLHSACHVLGYQNEPNNLQHCKNMACDETRGGRGITQSSEVSSNYDPVSSRNVGTQAVSGFQMPLHYPRYTKADYEKMEEWKVDVLLREERERPLSFTPHTTLFSTKKKTQLETPGMDELEKLRCVGKYQFLKNTMQIVMSVAFLSIFLCHSSSFAYSLFPHSFNVYFSTFLFSLFTHTLERKYMFLLCNGILAFIAKTSVSTRSTSITTKLASEIDGGEYDRIRHVPPQVEEPENGSLGKEEEEEEEESEASVVVEDDISGGEEEKGWPEKQEEEEEVAVSMSTEELNRKIEEFIRKMKEEIRIEAQQQQIIASN